MLTHHTPKAKDITQKLANDYALPPQVVNHSYEGRPEDDDSFYYIDREGITFAQHKIFGTALSFENNGFDITQAYGVNNFIVGKRAVVTVAAENGDVWKIVRDGIGISAGPAQKSYPGAATAAKKRALSSFGNSCGLFLSRANRADGAFDLSLYRQEYNAAASRGDAPKARHPEGVNLQAFDILHNPAPFKMNPLEAQTDVMEDGFRTRSFPRPAIIEMLNQYIGHLAWDYRIPQVEVGVLNGKFYGAVDVSLTLWPQAESPKSTTERGYNESPDNVTSALYGAEVAALKRAFSELLGVPGGIQFWSESFDLEAYHDRFSQQLTLQRENPDAEKLILEDLLLPNPPGWSQTVPQHTNDIHPDRVYKVPTQQEHSQQVEQTRQQRVYSG
jgi:hypothetical protein